MTAVTVREFSYNPSAMFARVERGETIEVTKHGHVIAMLVPPARAGSRFDELVAQGAIRKAESGLTTRDLDKYTRIEVPDDVDPLAILLEMRADER
jgi:antitoxin (DNA-binding transcriptional repressor) of toxin-antitoxin stability system